MLRKIHLLLFLLSPLLSFAQVECLDNNGDCSSIPPVELQFDVEISCGEIAALSPTDEICNTWTIPANINFQYGIGADSSIVYIGADQCLRDTIIVDGLTDTSDGTTTSTCHTKITYFLTPAIDTIQEEINCEEFILLESESEMQQGVCGCDSLLVQYTTDFSNCVGCGMQCIYITGTITISGGDTEGAEVLVTYVLNGDTLTAGRGDWTGEIEQLECFSTEDEVEVLMAEAFPPAGATGSTSADAWIVTSPGTTEMTMLFEQTCQSSEVGLFVDTLVASTGCDSIIMKNVDLFPLPTVTIENQYACTGDTTALFADSETAVSYLWNTGTTDFFLEVADLNTYTVTITDANGCTATASGEALFNSIEIELMPSVAGPLVLSANPLEVWQGAAIQMDLLISGTPFPYEIIWNGGPELGGSTYNYIAQESGPFKVSVIDSIGCWETKEVEVLVRPINVFVPTAFSPNGDFINDVFNVYTSPNVEEMRLQIFSRRGDLFFDKYLQNPIPDRQGLIWSGWDGSAKGKRVNPQVFAYQLSYKGIRGEWKVISGDLTLVKK